MLNRCARGEWRRIWPAGLVLLAGSAVALLQPWPIKLIIDVVLRQKPAPALLARWFAGIRQHFPLDGDPSFALLLVLCVAMLLIQLLVGLLHVLNIYLMVSIGLRMVFRLRCALFEHVQRLSVAFHDKTPVGDSLHRIVWDSYCVQSLFNGAIVPAIGAAATLLGITLVMLQIDWMLTLAALAISVPLVWLIRRMDRPMRERSEHSHQRESTISTRVQETLTGIRVVQAFGQEALEAERFHHDADQSLRAKLRLNLLQAASQAAVGLLLAAGTAAVTWIVARRVMQGQLSIGDVVLVLAYLAMLYKPLEMLAATAETVQSAAAGAGRVFAVLDLLPDIDDRPAALPLTIRPAGRLVLERVCFGYRPGQRVLHELDLEIPAGSTIALVGESGAGKTTLISLLLRFYDPTSGRILLDGRELREITLASLRQQVALVPQEPALFSCSIRENIAYARPGASLQQIRAAAQAAAAEEFILATPEGYDSQIGQRGVAISGGQRQRLAIARAFLKDAPILIMDEPTAALDAESELRLVEGMARLMRGRTTIIIAHRLSTVRNAGRIVVLDKGRIVEEGTYARLLGRGRLFRRLHELQVGIHATNPTTGVAQRA